MASKMSRRSFLKKSAASAAAVGFSLVGAPAIGQPGGVIENINIGIIGCGGRGTSLLRNLVRRSQDPKNKIKVVAVCDVYKPRLERAQQICGGKAFIEYRDMLQMPDLDAVVIATPDHWHAKMAIDSMEAGKDVYLEKPMTLYWEEAKQVHQTRLRTNRVVQIGAQSASQPRYWRGREVIENGLIGHKIISTCCYDRNVPGGDWNYHIDPNCSPENLDWERWLGPAPKRPFSKERFFRFRKYWDYSGGLATDLLYHALAHTMIALGPEFPTRVVATGGIFLHQDERSGNPVREVPDTFQFYADYPTEHTVAGFATAGNTNSVQEKIRGEWATIKWEGKGVRVYPEPKFKKEWLALAKEKYPDDVKVPEEPKAMPSLELGGINGGDHMQIWLDCIRTRKQPTLDTEAGYKVMVTIALSVLSYRQNKVMLFDPEKEELITT